MPVTVGGSPITPTQAEQLREALGVDGDPVTARLTSLNNTDDAIFLRASVPHLVAASVIADYVGAAPAATAPAAFTAGQWTATAGDTQVELNITALPSDGGSAITELRYRTTGSGSGTALSGTGTGVRTITGLTNGVALDFQIAAVNAVGTGAWSDVKSRTPSSSATAPAAFTAGQWDAAATATAGEMQYQITALPSDGGSAITALEYRVNTGSAIALTGTGTGNRTVTAGWSAGTAADTQVRAVNAIGVGAWSDTKNRTPAAGGGAASYLSDTFTAGTDVITITRPAGAGASHTLTAIVWSDIGGQNINTMAAPSGWTVNDGATNPTEGRSARVFTAPGDVSNLTFSQSGIRGVLCWAASANVRNTEFEGVDYSGPSNSSNRATPAVTAVADDLGVSVYIQYDDGSVGPLVDPGSPQAGWTRRYFKNAAAPYISILSRASLTAGSTGAVAHDANGNFSGRFVFTGTYGA